MRLSGWLFFENIVDKGTGVASGPVTIYWLGLEIRKVKHPKPSWLLSTFAEVAWALLLTPPPSPGCIVSRCHH